MIARLPTLPWHYEALRLRARGASVAEISARVGRGRGTVRRLLSAEQHALAVERIQRRKNERYALDEVYRERVKAANRARRARREAEGG